MQSNKNRAFFITVVKLITTEITIYNAYMYLCRMLQMHDDWYFVETFSAIFTHSCFFNMSGVGMFFKIQPWEYEQCSRAQLMGILTNRLLQLLSHRTDHCSSKAAYRAASGSKLL